MLAETLNGASHNSQQKHANLPYELRSKNRKKTIHVQSNPLVRGLPKDPAEAEGDGGQDNDVGPMSAFEQGCAGRPQFFVGLAVFDKGLARGHDAGVKTVAVLLHFRQFFRHNQAPALQKVQFLPALLLHQISGQDAERSPSSDILRLAVLFSPQRHQDD